VSGYQKMLGEEPGTVSSEWKDRQECPNVKDLPEGSLFRKGSLSSELSSFLYNIQIVKLCR